MKHKAFEEFKKELDEENRKFMLTQLKNIVVGEDGEYRLQNNYYLDEYGKMHDVVPYDKKKPCWMCWNGRQFYNNNINCRIFNSLNGIDENENRFIDSESHVVECAAFCKTEKLNIVRSMDDMIEFVKRVESFWRGSYGFDDYFGLDMKHDECGNLVETIDEYFARGGKSSVIPDKYPAVVSFDLNCEEPLEWIYIHD